MNLPSNPDAERAVLSCALQWPQCHDTVAAHPAGAELFYTPAHREIYSALSAVKIETPAPDMILVADELRSADRLEAVGGTGYLAELWTDSPSPDLLGRYLAIASETHRRRHLVRECHAMAAAACDDKADVDGLMQRLDTLSRRLSVAASEDNCRSWGDVAFATVDKLQAAFNEEGGKVPGLSTGYAALDERTNGMQPGQLWIVAARPGAGKTAFGFNIVENLVTAGTPCAVFSAEMYAEELAIRSISRQTGIDSLRLSRGDVYKGDFPRIAHALSRCGQWPLWIDDRAHMRLIDIQVGSRRMVSEHGVKVIVVDYLQLIKEPEGSRNREDAVRRLSDGLKQLAKELGITVIALAQLNRASEKRDGRKPSMSDLRDSGSIEQDANVVILLNPEEEEGPVITVDVIVAKCRGGKIGSDAYDFQRSTTTFRTQKAQ